MAAKFLPSLQTSLHLRPTPGLFNTATSFVHSLKTSSCRIVFELIIDPRTEGARAPNSADAARPRRRL